LASLVTKQPVVTTPQALMPVGATFWREGHFLSEISGVTSPDQLPRGAWELEVLESVWSGRRSIGGGRLGAASSARPVVAAAEPPGLAWFAKSSRREMGGR
jgi:hypothetical protein